jgi:hypothetical protein
MNQTLIGPAMSVLKILIVVGLILYAGFAAIVVRQEQLMANVLEESSETFLRIFALLHLGAAIFAILLAVIVL